MEKEEKIVVILLTMAILSLSVAYLAYYPNDITGRGGKELTSNCDIGERVWLEGVVFSKTTTFKGDHLILNVDHDSQLIAVFIPNNNGASEIDNMIRKNDRVHIIGILDEYKGDKEIVVQDKKDVILLDKVD
ncbi:MAG: OB-fold nucleic acid binding domain-containing protein [Methanosarcinaceae archaeon]|nr:OB-fold nucleic acid binding domain-containing protein [Methanosarcinaceae archaeon]